MMISRRREPFHAPATRRRSTTSAVLLVLLLCAGCSGTAAPTSPASSAAQGRPAAAGDAAALLAERGRQIRGQLDGLVTALRRTTQQRTVLIDTSGPCTIGTPARNWPQRWGYSLSMKLDPMDALPTARQAAALLRAQGWKVVLGGVTSDVADLNATKDGSQIRLLAGESPGGLDFEAYSQCIGPTGARVTVPN